MEEDSFLQFEKIAKLKKWNTSDWALLILSKFKRKAREAYVTLNDEEARDYEIVKEAVLKSARLNPGVYREGCRNVKKDPGSTYLEMARECCLIDERSLRTSSRWRR